ncbi:MAG: putative 4-hydroxybenzoate polyprenyltransferase [Taibaiella sp.]|nr:putative 4-hydroxybenzoate polyprenyltransferase [Taibaiella sp.]
MQRVKDYLSLIKFSHTVFALPFALIGFSLAVIYERHSFEWHLLVKMLLCMVFARTAAMAFNRYLDRRIDARNPRTAKREIPAGVIEPKSALWFVIANCVLFVITCYFINMLVFYLSFVALFVILFYSYTKRFTALCHLVLGVGLSLAPIGAYLVVTGEFSWLPLMFSGIVITWVSGFDIIYALQDESFDRDNRLYSIPAALGVKHALSVSALLHIISAGLVIAVGFVVSLNWLYWAGAALFIGLLIYQHTLVKPYDLSKVNIAFMTTNGIGSIVFAIFTILSLIF